MEFPTVTFRERGRFAQGMTAAERRLGEGIERMAFRAFWDRYCIRCHVSPAENVAVELAAEEWVRAGRRDGGRAEEAYRRRRIDEGHPPPGEGFFE